MRYTVIFERQPNGGYHASCPALPGCHSEGDTIDNVMPISDRGRPVTSTGRMA